MVIDFAIRLGFSVEACPTRSYIHAYGVPAYFQGICAVDMRRMFRKVPLKRPIHPKFTSPTRSGLKHERAQGRRELTSFYQTAIHALAIPSPGVTHTRESV
jgi:hypothetical protein